MKYVNLETTYKRKISGSISFIIKSYGRYSNYKDITGEEVFSEWIDTCTEIDAGKRYYRNKNILIDTYILEGELLEDLKVLFYERVEKKKQTILCKLENELATEKQINYANLLYNKLFKKDNNYEYNRYTKGEINIIIDELKTKEVKSYKKEECIIIDIKDFI